MKKIISIFLSFSIVFLSVSTCIPISVCADTDKTVLSKSSDSPFAYSSSEAQKYVSAHLDIYDSDNTLLFSYTPTSTYNWTYSAKGKDNLHLSDNQLKAFLMSKKTLSAYAQLMFSGFSNNNVTRGFLSALGIATTGNSNALTDVSDKLLGNYNYLDSINYDEDTQTITMSNDNSSVDKLREEIKQYYYDSIGLRRSKSNDKTKNPGAVITFLHTFYEYEEDYTSDFMACNQYDYATCSYMNYSYSVYFAVAFDKSSYSYAYIDNSSNLYFTDKDLSILDDDSVVHVFLNHYKNSSTGIEYDLTFSKMSVINGLSAKFLYSSGSVVSSGYINQNNRFYSQKGIDFVYFSSFEKLYNFVHGSQTAYLSSRIDKAGEDISYSIKDMNENLGSKMDELIDSINSGKGNMSADELQNAIDKGLEELNKNTEDIKDNTSDILEVLKEQNNILLQILGVTEYIAYQNDKYNNTYTKADMSNLFKKSFNRVSDAVLYGEKVDDDNENTVDRSKFSYHNGIFGHFPFSVPYQLYEWLKVFQAEPECPEFTYHYGFLIGISKDNDEYDKYKITFNLSAYDSWRKVATSFLKLSFTLTMAIGTYKKFKGEL
ncbi:MAG: hypothetical protein KHX32_03465 [Clostridiales bacterium]|nr:hypothetical protein [Clostridiales bacterium]